jgi:hypothetical protein
MRRYSLYRPERRSRDKASGVHLRIGRYRFASRFGARWIAAAVAVVLLWGDCAYAAEARVFLLRGWFGVFSRGLDSLADELKAEGINAEVIGHLAWKTAVSKILRERAAGQTGPLILVGHSQGANNVIDMARALAAEKVTVDLLVTLAPFMQDSIPANVAQAINYYQSHGWGAPITPDPGFRGKLSNVELGPDVNTLHVTIDKNSRVHADISRAIAGLSQTR